MRERQEVKEEIEEVEQQVVAIGSSKISLNHQVRLLNRWECQLSPFDPCRSVFRFQVSFLQELREELSSQKAKLENIMEKAQYHYPEMPADISRRLEDVLLSIRKEEERVTDLMFPVACYNFRIRQKIFHRLIPLPTIFPCAVI